MSIKQHKICIIGAGSSGIVACKVLQTKGLAYDCYEKGSGIGGNWRYNNDNGMSSAYRSLHINTSKTMMAYSDYPMPASYPAYPHHSQILAYFEEYADHFKIKEHIIFNTAIADVHKEADGTYTVMTDKGEQKNYTAVIVANGHHWNPRYPEPAFAGEFVGEVMHAHDYKTPEILENKNVLVVGIGNSALDIACEAARLNTGKVFISTRRGAHIFPKYIFGMPFDMLGKVNAEYVPFWFKQLLLRVNLWVARGRQENYGVPKPKHPLLAEHPSISQDFLNLAGHGKVQVKPNIRELAGKEVLFEDGSKEAIDLMVYATGYKISFPFFKSDFINNDYVEETNDFPLYRRVINVEHDNLFFIGLCQPLGAIMPLAETQSHWIANILTGEVALPSKAYMEHHIQQEQKALAKRYNASKRHTIQVDFLAYQNEIKKEMKQMQTDKRIVKV
jgi:hypothetical protein